MISLLKILLRSINLVKTSPETTISNNLNKLERELMLYTALADEEVIKKVHSSQDM